MGSKKVIRDFQPQTLGDVVGSLFAVNLMNNDSPTIPICKSFGGLASAMMRLLAHKPRRERNSAPHPPIGQR